MQKNNQSLVDYLSNAMGCNSVSDLHALNSADRKRLVQILSKIQTNDYSLFQWNDALDYLADECAQDTEEKARELLCLRLKE